MVNDNLLKKYSLGIYKAWYVCSAVGCTCDYQTGGLPQGHLGSDRYPLHVQTGRLWGVYGDGDGEGAWNWPGEDLLCLLGQFGEHLWLENLQLLDLLT